MKTYLYLIKSGILILILGSAFLGGCGSSKLDGEFDEETLINTAKEVIALFDEGEYEKICKDYLREDLQDQLKPSDLEAAEQQVMHDRGAFVEYTAENVTGTNTQSTEKSAVVVLIVKYENKRVTYTILFDPTVKMTGFWMK